MKWFDQKSGYNTFDWGGVNSLNKLHDTISAYQHLSTGIRELSTSLESDEPRRAEVCKEELLKLSMSLKEICRWIDEECH
jgi:hypothetical protein